MKRFPLSATLVTAITAASFTLAGCAAETEQPVDETETAMEADDGALSGAEIEEAAPGIEDAQPEGETGNTADLGEPENVEYTDDPNSNREADTARD